MVEISGGLENKCDIRAFAMGLDTEKHDITGRDARDPPMARATFIEVDIRPILVWIQWQG
jgi:hypothetical protein